VPSQPAKPDLRASDADREAAVERLRTAALEGRLDDDELEGRLASAYRARTCSDLAALTADVIPPADPLVFLRAGRRRLNALALISLFAGFLWFGWVGSIAAIVTGHVALHQIGRSSGTEYGRAAAVVGLCFGYFGLATLVFVLSFAISF
jgi:uncharacterized protein DUF1707/uncharacterized protein DUF4190